MLASRADVLALQPDYPALADVKLGVVAPWRAADGSDAHFEVRAFIPTRASEDPVTGSLNAGLAQWLISAGLAPDTYVAAQGTVLGRAGRVHVQREGNDIWIGGSTVTCITGKIDLGWLKHDPEKWEPGFRRRSCSNKKQKRDGNSTKRHRALAHLSRPPCSSRDRRRPAPHSPGPSPARCPRA